MKEYAPFFEWFEKDRKELGVVEELLESVNRMGRTGYYSPQIYRPDPPDCVCLNSSAALVALEVSEVVCEKAARLTAQGNQVMRVWRPGELTTRVAELLAEKDKKIYHGGPYAEIVASLFTDEPLVTPEHADTELSSASFGPYKQLTAAFLLLSYNPNTKTYPVVALRIVQ